MTAKLCIDLGQYSDNGTKENNQDFHGASTPSEHMLASKGLCIAIADGISSSEVSHIASQTAVHSFLEDYYCTSESWSVKSSASRVIQATNSWIFAQNQRIHSYRVNRDRGYVCTFSALVIKSATAHVFHIGDSQIARLNGNTLEPLTTPHRRWVSEDVNYLSRALGIAEYADVDYHSLPVKLGDTFLLSTDGIYEHISAKAICHIIKSHYDDLDLAAKRIAQAAIENGSQDNVTVQIVRIAELPSTNTVEFLQHNNAYPFPPELSPRMQFDGFELLRDIHRSNRSHVLLAKDNKTGKHAVIKTLSQEGRKNPDSVERFLLEEWVAKRLKSPHILKLFSTEKPRNYVYVATEYIEGQPLSQWLADNPKPSLETVRGIIAQVAKGLQAFHRQEMLHQDLRPHNIMIDTSNTVKIIDFGSTFIAGIEEMRESSSEQWNLGTAAFMAPEYFLGELGTKQSDIYSLACTMYFMLTGRFPYGSAVAKTQTRAGQNRLTYQPIRHKQESSQEHIPLWVDLTLKKALHVNPEQRYQELSEFVHDLHKPNKQFINRTHPPLAERNPVKFWQGVSAILFLIIVVMVLL